MGRVPRRRLLVALALAVGVTVFGTAGYMLLGDASPLDALYMTVVTVAAVGYDESIRLEGPARLFTLAVIVMGVGSISFVVISGLDFVVEGHLEALVGRRRMDRELGRLRDHTVVCGFGQVGRHVAGDLAAEDEALVVVDIDPEKVDAARDAGLLAVVGDASLEETLAAVGLERARAVVASAHDDADNVLISLTAKGLNADALVIARIKQDENEAKVRRAGADRVIAPATIGGRRIAALITRPGVMDFLDVVSRSNGEDLVLEELRVEAGGDLDGRSLRELSLRDRYGVTVLSVRSEGRGSGTRPEADTVLRAGDVLIVIAGRDALEALRT